MHPNNPPYPMATPPQGYPQQGVSSMPPSMFPPPQEGMIQVNPEKLQGQQAAAGPSNAYPPPPNAYPPPSSGYPPTSSAYPPAPGAYPPQPDPYQPAQGVPVQGYPVGYAPGPIGGTPAGYPGAAPPAGPPGAMYMTGPPPADDGKAGPIVCVAIVLFIIGIFFPLLWIVVALMPFCARGQNARTQATLRRISMMAAVAMVIYLIIAVILGVMSATRWNQRPPARCFRYDPITGMTRPC